MTSFGDRIKILVIVLGGFLVFWGFRELSLSGKAKSRPQQITCAELIANGPGDNAYVQLSDFVGCAQWFVYEGQGENGPYKKVYLPAVELEGAWHKQVLALLAAGKTDADVPEPQNVRLLLKLNDMKNPDAVQQVIDQDVVTGMIVNSIEKLESQERRLLRQGYPNLDIDGCCILEIG